MLSCHSPMTKSLLRAKSGGCNGGTKSEEKGRKRKTPQDDQVDGAKKDTAHFIVKEKIYGTIRELLDKFSVDLLKLKNHVYNRKLQHKMYTGIRENLKDEEALLHIDFAENYGCKCATEIQSVHFWRWAPTWYS